MVLLARQCRVTDKCEGWSAIASIFSRLECIGILGVLGYYQFHEILALFVKTVVDLD